MIVRPPQAPGKAALDQDIYFFAIVFSQAMPYIYLSNSGPSRDLQQHADPIMTEMVTIVLAKMYRIPLWDTLAKLLGDFWQLPAWEKAWLAIGFAGQLVFMGRFLVQWIVSERRKRSVIPLSFWYLSLAGSVILLSYSIHKRDPVFILGLSLNSLIYVRNLWLIYRPGQSTPKE